MSKAASRPPNVVFVMSDDHAAHAISTYNGRLNQTPQLDRLATEGARFDAAFCTNSICAPSRAAILCGTYNHVNGVTTLDTHLDNTQWTFPQALGDAGYQTALFGKWHLGHGPSHDPTMFHKWRVLPGQGHYHNPVFIDDETGIDERGGYVTDLITDDCIEWLDNRNPEQPFALFCQHKAPHRHWEPAPRHFDWYTEVDIAEPPTLFDDLEGRAESVQAARMRIMDLDPVLDLKATVPPGLTETEEIRWRYQRYIKDYLRVVAAVDDSMGRLLHWLDENNLTEDTIVVYTSDQGFFLGDHSLFDKRLMYEESLTMPLLVRYPRRVAPQTVVDAIVTNIDFGPTLLDWCGVSIPDSVQGRSFAPLAEGAPPSDWPQEMYYRYWMHNDGAHSCPAHYGIRTETHKLICYYNDPLGQPGAHGPSGPVEWELFDLKIDPLELHNVAHDPNYAQVRAELIGRLARLQGAVGDTPYPGGNNSKV